MNNFYVGIDCGLKGGICVIHQAGRVVSADVMPIEIIRTDRKKHKSGKNKGQMYSVDVYDMNYREVFEMLSINNPFIAIEKQQAMPDQGVSSTAKTMKNYGILVGIAHSLYEMGDLCTSYEMISPITWKNYYKENYYKITDKKDACRLAKELSGK